jgi:hypothetical protein
MDSSTTLLLAAAGELHTDGGVTPLILAAACESATDGTTSTPLILAAYTLAWFGLSTCDALSRANALAVLAWFGLRTSDGIPHANSLAAVSPTSSPRSSHASASSAGAFKQEHCSDCVESIRVN